MLSSHYHLIITLFALTTFVVAGCSSSKKDADCQQFAKHIEAIGQEAATAPNSFFSANSTTQDYIAILNSRADEEERGAQEWQAIQLQEPKSKAIQSQIAEPDQAMSQVFRDEAKTLESLPGETDRQAREAAQEPFKQVKRDILKRSSDAIAQLDKYCGWQSNSDSK